MSEKEMPEMISAELEMDPQHGPIIRVRLNGREVSVYLTHETGTVVGPNGGQYGIEVKGPWHKYRQSLKDYAMTRCPSRASCDQIKEKLAQLERETDDQDGLTVCDCCGSLTSEPDDAGDHMQCPSCTEVAVLLARVAELEKVVKAAYIEGFDSGYESSQYWGQRGVDEGWEGSAARAALEGK